MVHQTTCGKDVVGPSASLECVDEEDTPSVSCQLSVCEKGNAKSHGCWCGGVSDGGVGVGWLTPQGMGKAQRKQVVFVNAAPASAVR